jgi:hypothetical protein
VNDEILTPGEAEQLMQFADEQRQDIAALRAECERLRNAVLAYLDGAPLTEHGRFRDERRETLYRALQEPPEGLSA